MPLATENVVILKVSNKARGDECHGWNAKRAAERAESSQRLSVGNDNIGLLDLVFVVLELQRGLLGRPSILPEFAGAIVSC